MKRAKKRIILPPGDEGPTIEELPLFDELDTINMPRRCVTQRRETVSSSENNSDKKLFGSSGESSSDSSDTKN